MLSQDELNQIIANYLVRHQPFDEFADAYRRASRGKFGAHADVLQACLKIDAALSMFYFDSATEEELREELANAIRPFRVPVYRLHVQVYLSRNRAFDSIGSANSVQPVFLNPLPRRLANSSQPVALAFQAG